MVNDKQLEEIKRLSIISLVSDDELMDKLVLKGGNAINMVLNISNRASLDIDMSMKEDFTKEEVIKLKDKLYNLFDKTFLENGYKIIDFNVTERPENINPEVKHFWGGYYVEFKVLKKEDYNQDEKIENLRKKTIQLQKNNSPKYSIDISKYEFVDAKRETDFDGYTLYAYTPEMLICEKIRAICQQDEHYKDIVKSMTPKSRGRDFFDIEILIEKYKVDLTKPENIEILKKMFEAKKVPLEYLKQIKERRELHKSGFEAVKDTVTKKEEVKEFDYYFKYVLNKVDEIIPLL